MFLVKYPEDYSPILEYYEGIKSGAEVVSRKIARVYRKLAEDLNGSVGADGTVYHYSHSRANHILEFAENYCRHSKGKLGGQLVVLELWEKAMLAAVSALPLDADSQMLDSLTETCHNEAVKLWSDMEARLWLMFGMGF